jgi:hypothetical protein
MKPVEEWLAHNPTFFPLQTREDSTVTICIIAFIQIPLQETEMF